MQSSEEFISLLYRKEYTKLFRAAYRMTGNTELTLDMVQDTFLLALSHQQDLIIHPKPEAWLMTTLQNLIKNERRLSANGQLSLEELVNQPTTESDPSLHELLPSQLSEDEKEILIWRFEQEQDYREIAARLGISETGSRSRVSRIIAKCKKYLRDFNSHG